MSYYVIAEQLIDDKGSYAIDRRYCDWYDSLSDAKAFIAEHQETNSDYRYHLMKRKQTFEPATD